MFYETKIANDFYFCYSQKCLHHIHFQIYNSKVICFAITINKNAYFGFADVWFALQNIPYVDVSKWLEK